MRGLFAAVRSLSTVLVGGLYRDRLLVGFLAVGYREAEKHSVAVRFDGQKAVDLLVGPGDSSATAVNTGSTGLLKRFVGGLRRMRGFKSGKTGIRRVTAILKSGLLVGKRSPSRLGVT